MGALVISTGAFLAFYWLAWNHAPEGQKFAARWAWPASWAVVAVVVSLFMTVLGAWWTVGPFG